MENAHREHVKNLFRWWNGHVFSFETVQGTNRDDDGFDSGMDEAEAAINSDQEFSGENSVVTNFATLIACLRQMNFRQINLQCQWR